MIQPTRTSPVVNACLIIVSVLLFLLLHSVSSPAQTSLSVTGDLSMEIDANSRIYSLQMGEDSEILFCDGMTGGFYIRDNTPVTAASLPDVPPENHLITGSYPGFPYGSIGYLGDTYWTYAAIGGSSIVESHDLNDSGNYVARFWIDEQNSGSDEGNYALLYHDFGPGSLPITLEHELYYLVFEVKTECGWRSKDHPKFGSEAYAPADHGHHRISARVEWYTDNGFTSTTPDREPPALTPHSTFYAFETTEGVDADNQHLTRFCGRLYRPVRGTDDRPPYRYARLVLMVEGFMPNDNVVITGVDNFVLIDNVYFFKAPSIRQVKGREFNLFTNEGEVSLVTPLGNPLDLKMDLTVEQNDTYIRLAGTLINNDGDPGVDQPARAIDLGFALPILDNMLQSSSGQKLTWHYDTTNSTHIEDEGLHGLHKIYPFTLSGPIDIRPDYATFPKNPLTERAISHNPAVSAYPLSSLSIESGGEPPDWHHGLAFGDSLEDDPPCPSISRFGYFIIQPYRQAYPTYRGHYFVEFQIGLLGEDESTSTHPGTDFSFIIFRSDDENLHEQSSFREGLERYQTEIYPGFFTRPTFTQDTEWLFGGGFFGPNLNDPDDDGYEVDPNDFGFRYTQQAGGSGMGLVLQYCKDNNIRAMLYDRPWAGTFVNDIDDDTTNTYDVLDTEGGNHNPAGYDQASYGSKFDLQFRIPPCVPNTNTLARFFSRRIVHKEESGTITEAHYGFPTLLSLSPTPPPTVGNPVAHDIIEDYYDTAYSNWADPGLEYAGLGGIELDNTFGDTGKSNHLNLDDFHFTQFTNNGGRLTYSPNHFLPAIPQLVTNVWFFPHIHDKLAAIDGNPGYNWGDGTGAGANIEEEIVTINAHEGDFGGSKYGIMNAGVIGFESSPGQPFNNTSAAFNFRRAIARQKSVARLFNPHDCQSNIEELFSPSGCNPTTLWADDYELYKQIIHEASWMALAWGFHPSIQLLIPVTDPVEDDLIDPYVRPVFWFLDPQEPRVGYANIFQQLHKAGWQPVKNVEVEYDGIQPDGEELYVERFGPPPPGMLPRCLYLTLLNNNDFTITIDDVSMYGGTNEHSLREFESSQEIEDSGICDDNYACEDFNKDRTEMEDYLFGPQEREVYLNIHNPWEYGLHTGNLHGQQMIQHPVEGLEINPVNTPTIPAEIFDTFGYHFSLKRQLMPLPSKVILGGQRNILQYPISIESKALMVFKIWTTLTAGNGDLGGGREDGTAESTYYARAGNGWTTTNNDRAHDNTLDVIGSTEQQAFAAFRVDIGVSGEYDVRVSYPVDPAATTRARYDVYVADYDEERSLINVEAYDTAAFAFSAVVDQTSKAWDAADDDGFVSIGTLRIDVEERQELKSVLVVLRHAGSDEELREGSLLLADAVKLVELE